MGPLLALLRDEAVDAFLLPPSVRKPGTLAQLHENLRTAGVTRPELFDSTRPTSKAIRYYDLRATGITWCAVRNEHPQAIMRHAGHSGFETTQKYIRIADDVREGFGEPFPPLPDQLLGGTKHAPSARSASKATELQRREWDSNPRWVAPHTISSRAPSASRSSLLGGACRGERRELGSIGQAVGDGNLLGPAANCVRVVLGRGERESPQRMATSPLGAAALGRGGSTYACPLSTPSGR